MFSKTFFQCAYAAVGIMIATTLSGCAVVSVASTVVSVGVSAVGVGVSAATTVAKGAVHVTGAVIDQATD